VNDASEALRLYEKAVQSPEIEIELFERVYRDRFDREPGSLREDFCGSALLCRHWVESDAERVALGVDLDPSVIARAGDMNRAPLDEDEAERFEIACGDARERSDRTFDVITAGNFSWALFDEASLATYLASARDCLEDEGLLALELFGGGDLRRALRHEHTHQGFVYVWEQRRYDAPSRRLSAAIHFRLSDGRELTDAFRYEFVVRSWAETRRALDAAGFAEVVLFIEEEAGGFVATTSPPDRPVWGGYAMAFCR